MPHLDRVVVQCLRIPAHTAAVCALRTLARASAQSPPPPCCPAPAIFSLAWFRPFCGQSGNAGKHLGQLAQSGHPLLSCTTSRLPSCLRTQTAQSQPRCADGQHLQCQHCVQQMPLCWEDCCVTMTLCGVSGEAAMFALPDACSPMQQWQAPVRSKRSNCASRGMCPRMLSNTSKRGHRASTAARSCRRGRKWRHAQRAFC